MKPGKPAPLTPQREAELKLEINLNLIKLMTLKICGDLLENIQKGMEEKK